MKSLKAVCLLGAGVLASAMMARPVQAKTLLWWRIGDGYDVTNIASPGTMDGAFRSIKTYGSVNGLDATTDPTKIGKTATAFPRGARVIDPIEDKVAEGTPFSGSWSGMTTNSCIFAPYKQIGALNALKMLTFEAFVYLPSSEVPVQGETKMYNIVEHGREDNNFAGYSFGLYRSNNKLQPYLRCIALKADGSGTTVNLSGKGPDVSRDTWHHVAFTLSETGVMKTYLDYAEIGSATIADYRGLRRPTTEFPFVVGSSVYRGHWAFAGRIADVRVSDRVLDRKEMLRPVPAGSTDKDTLIHLSFDDTWFGQPVGGDYAGSPYAYALNGAPTGVYSPRWSYQSLVTENDSLDSVVVCAEQIRTGILSPEVVTGGASLKRCTRVKQSTYWSQNVLYIPDPEKDLGEDAYPATCEIPQHDFTFEVFFKTDGTLPNTGDLDTYTILQGTWCKICVYRANGKLLTRLINPKGSSIGDVYNSTRVDDGKWHHYALVYRKAEKVAAAWLDGALVKEFATPDGLKTASAYASRYLNFGAEHSNSQGFQGHLDEMRLVRRALSPSEFLRTEQTPAAADSRTLFETDFGDGTAFSSDPASVGSVGTAKDSGVSVVSGRDGKLFWDGVVGRDVRTVGKGLRLENGWVHYPSATALDRCEFTVEFFAKIDSCAQYVNLLRISPSRTEKSDVAWAVYYRGGTSSGLIHSLNCTTNGLAGGAARRSDQFALKDSVSAVADGQWHHWAFTFRVTDDLTTEVVSYRDHRQVNAVSFLGTPYFGSNGSSLAIGYGTSGSLDATLEHVRISDGVLTTDEFMRFHERPGLLIFLK